MFNKKWSIVFALTIIAITFMHANMAKTQVVTEGLVSYWSFDNADIDDDIAKDGWGDNHGTIVSDPKVVEGKVGEALEFDGEDDFVDMGNPADGSLDFGADRDFSICTWINVSEAADQYTIVCKGDHGGNPRILFKIKNEFVFVTLANEPGGGPKPDFTSNTSVVDGEWHYVALVADRDRATEIYIDGALDAEGIASEGTDVTTESPMFIGKSHNEGRDNRRFIKGIIDEVCIYSRALNETDVGQNMNAEGLAVVNSAEKLAISWAKIK